MTTTGRILSVSLPVADQDRAKAFYTEVLGFEVRSDVEALPGARLVEVAPPGSEVSIVLLPPDSDIPMAVRLTTPDGERAHRELADRGVQLHNDEVIHIGDYPPMFFFADPDGNGLVYLQILLGSHRTCHRSHEPANRTSPTRPLPSR